MAWSVRGMGLPSSPIFGSTLNVKETPPAMSMPYFNPCWKRENREKDAMPIMKIVPALRLTLSWSEPRYQKKHTQQHQTANEDEKRVIEEIVDEGERSGHSARCG